MQVFEVGGEAYQLRFLPDNRRLLIGIATPSTGEVTFEVVSLPGGDRARLNVPGAKLQSWFYESLYGNAIAVHPSGDLCYIAWAGTLYAFGTADGSPRPVPNGVKAHQVVLSPAGDRLLAAARVAQERHLVAVRTGPAGGEVVWQKSFPPVFTQVAGFLPDGERFVTVDGTVRIRSFGTGDQVGAGKHKPQGVQQPQISPDGRHLGMIGYGNMYVWDLTTLAKPRKIAGTATFGDFRSFAFHPDGRTLAVIHGGPTLVKVYELATLERTQTWTWKLGPLRSVAFSPDGTLGAAGSCDGRIIVWDVGG